MLRTIYAMLASGTYYQDKSVDYEALSVANNAPGKSPESGTSVRN